MADHLQLVSKEPYGVRKWALTSKSAHVLPAAELDAPAVEDKLMLRREVWRRVAETLALDGAKRTSRVKLDINKHLQAHPSQHL